MSHKSLYRWPAGYYDHERYETASWDGRQAIGLEIVRCKDCGLVFSSPSFRAQHLSLIYPEEIVPEFSDEALVSLLKQRKWDRVIAEIRKRLAPGASVVDIGTRYGVLPSQLQAMNFRALGVEYNPRSVRVAARIGAPAHCGTIRDLEPILRKEGLERVNAFVLVDVLEHLVDPASDLRELARFQRAGDFLFLQQMDFDSWGRRLFRGNWYYFQPAAHMTYFSEATLSRFLRSFGYQVVAVRRASAWANVRTLIRSLGRSGMTHRADRKPLYLQERRRLNDICLFIARKTELDPLEERNGPKWQRTG